MDKTKGWIKLWRCVQDNPLWTSEPFTRGQAWVDLLMLANHERAFFFKRNVKIVVERGQVGRSEVELADRWKWSRTKVRSFLNCLEKEQQVIQQKNNITLILTLINYEEYQKKEQQDGQQQDSKSTAEEQQQDTYKNDKNLKNDNKEQNIIADESAIDVCPHQEIIKIYHEELPQLRKVKIWNDARMSFLRARWREDTERQNIEWWRDFFKEISRSDFLTGKIANKNGGKNFSADLEWIVRPANFVKILEGKYSNGKGQWT